MDEVQGVVPWHHFLLVMGVAEGSGDLRTNDTHPRGMQLMLLCVHGRTGYRAGCQSHRSGTISPRASKFQTGNVHSSASAHDRRYNTDHNASPVRASNQHRPTVTWWAGCAGCADHDRFSRWGPAPPGDAQRTARRPWREPATARRSLTLAPTPLIHWRLTRASGPTGRGTGTRYRFRREPSGDAEWSSDTRWQVPR